MSARAESGKDTVKLKEAPPFPFKPPKLTVSKFGPRGHASTTGSANVTMKTVGSLLIVHAAGKLTTSATCAKASLCEAEPGPVSSAGSSTLSLHFTDTGEIPYELRADLSTSGASPAACAGIEVDLPEAGQSLVVNSKNGVDPDCNSGVPKSGSFDVGGTFHSTTGFGFTLTADTCCPDPGTKRTDTLGATWAVDLYVSSPCTITGTPGDETLPGTSGDDVICGMGGTDSMDGVEGNDVIVGGPGQDTMDGGLGNDALFGLGGDDFLSDVSGPNRVLSGGGGSDALCGSPDHDLIIAGDGLDAPVAGGGGADTIDGGSGNDLIQGGKAALCDTGSGPDGADTITGGSGDDLINGAARGDHIFGGRGSDKLRGDGGEDLLNGGARTDVLNGGAGNDTLNACDGTRDTLVGGPGILDVGGADPVDVVHKDVEQVIDC